MSTVVLELPADAEADVDAESVSGHITTQFPVAGKIDKHEVKARIGGGERVPELETVNGNVEIRKR